MLQKEKHYFQKYRKNAKDDQTPVKHITVCNHGYVSCILSKRNKLHIRRGFSSLHYLKHCRCSSLHMATKHAFKHYLRNRMLYAIGSTCLLEKNTARQQFVLPYFYSFSQEAASSSFLSFLEKM